MIRVRYAPSPTGSPHVGNIRTALFNYLLAKRYSGTFVVRIEDTDQTRKVPGALEDILDSLRWLGIEWDEGPERGGSHGPYFQSERLEIYRRHVDILLAAKRAYKCFCTPEELTEMREYQRINNLPTGYDRRCRFRSDGEVEALEASGKPYVVRLAMPLEGEIEFQDAIRGRVAFESRLLDDQVLLKSDGWPTYHLASVVDDYLQGITHVIRGDEWINSTPKHVVLYNSFGWNMPIFAHAPIIKGPDGAKLSKRHGDTRCLDYREKGFLSEAVANFIALIGWSPGDERELMTMSEMAEAFSVEGIQPNPGVFDITKLLWMNGHYIRSKSPEDLFDTVVSWHTSTTDEEYRGSQGCAALTAAIQSLPQEYVTEALRLEQERVKLLSEFAEACRFFFVDEPEMDPQGVAKWFGQPYVGALLEKLEAEVAGRSTISPEDAEKIIDGVVVSLGLEKRAQAIHPTRVALTGKTFGPSLFELMALLGPERILLRLRRAAQFVPAAS